jgi:ribosomal protein S18 acetylase RimI-like enzyme
MSFIPVSFRPATFHEAPLIVELVNSAYRGDSGRKGWTTEADLLDGQRTDMEEVLEAISAADSMILLGESLGEILASAHLEKTGADAYLGMLAVNPLRQGQGLGKRLMNAAERLAAERWGAAAMRMSVIALREDLIAFYERRGYARTGRTRPFPASEQFGIAKVPNLTLEELEKRLRDFV